MEAPQGLAGCLADPLGSLQQRRDEWAARGAIARPRLGRSLNKLLGLRSDENYRQWHDREGNRALKSEAFAELLLCKRLSLDQETNCNKVRRPPINPPKCWAAHE
jgi:hypothetical protein